MNVAHIMTTVIMGFIAGLITCIFSGWAIRSKAFSVSEETKFAKYTREPKESAFALIAGFSVCIPTLYGVTHQPKYAAVISGATVWCILAVASGMYWYRKYPEVFNKSQR